MQRQVEAAEAAARARRMVALLERRSREDQDDDSAREALEHRVAEQLAVQREAALRQRSRWLVALTALGFATAAAAGWLAFAAQRNAEAARTDRDDAIAALAGSERAMRDTLQTLERTTRDLAELRARFDNASRRAAASDGDAAHGDAAHGDAAHGDAAHGDAAHGDTRTTRAAPRPPHGRTAQPQPAGRIARTGVNVPVPQPAPITISDDCLITPLCNGAPKSATATAAPGATGARRM